MINIYTLENPELYLSPLAEKLLIRDCPFTTGYPPIVKRAKFGNHRLTRKPEFEDKRCHFNLSHDEGVIAIAYSKDPIGIDVAKMTLPFNKDPEKWLRTMTYNLPSEDRRLLISPFLNNLLCEAASQNIDCRVRTFKLYWALKEAFMKFTGFGLSLGLNSFILKSEEVETSSSVTSERLPIDVEMLNDFCLDNLSLKKGLQKVSFWVRNHRSSFWIVVCKGREENICWAEIDL